MQPKFSTRKQDLTGSTATTFSPSLCVAGATYTFKVPTYTFKTCSDDSWNRQERLVYICATFDLHLQGLLSHPFSEIGQDFLGTDDR